jgi:hypothetical protein
MPAATLIKSNQDIKTDARSYAKDVLRKNGIFRSMSLNDQRSVYVSLVQDYINTEKKKAGGMARSMADSGSDMGFKGYNPDFSGDTKAFNDLVDSVDFPKFVGDLLKAVFDANLTVMKKQTDAFIGLMKECTKEVGDFVKQVKDDDAFASLATSSQGKYNVDIEKSPDGASKMILTDANGEKVDQDNAEVKKDLAQAKLKMAQEHRAALREVLLMGVTRLVVDKGTVEAAVTFTIKAHRDSQSTDSNTNTNVVNLNTQFGGGLGSIFGGPSASMTETNTNINVKTSTKNASDDLTAELQGKVNIQFKTDYFKLDNFAQMYGDGGTQALKPQGQGQGQPALGPAK